MQRTFHEKRPADEAVRRANEAHDGDFLAAREDSQANRVVDEHKRDEDEQHDERDADIADVGRQLEELCDRLLTIFKRLGRRIVAADGSKRGVLLNLARHVLDELRVRKLDLDGGRQRVLPVERIDDVGIRRGLEILERLVLRGEVNRCDAVDAADEILDLVDVRLRGVIGDERRDADLVLDRRHDVVHHNAAHEEDADDKQREENRDDGTQGSGEVASEPVQRLLEEVTETTHRNRTPPCPGRG